MVIEFKLCRQSNKSCFRAMSALPLIASLLMSACVSKPYPVPVVEQDWGRYQRIPGSTLTNQEGKRIYVVQRGDTLYSIALKYGLDVNQLAERNSIIDPRELRIGQEIELYVSLGEGQVPHPEQTTSQPILYSISEDSSSDLAGYKLGVLPLNDQESSALLKTEPRAAMLPYSDATLSQLGDSAKATPSMEMSGKNAEVSHLSSAEKSSGNDDASRLESRNSSGINWGWPVDGQVMSRFSQKSKGVGIAGRAKQPVLASASGVVVYSGSGLRGYGNLVIIKHNDTYLSAYGHNSKVFVHEGEKVSRGQKIAEMGNTEGGAVKLHFEIRERGKPVDPLNFLPNR
jgi:lipoprotein NlpD